MTPLNKLVKEGSAKRIDLNSEEWKDLVKSMNDHMKMVRREYIIKARQSEIDASKVILNC